MKDDLNTLRRLLQRNKNQHRRGKYFQLISGAEKKLRRWVEADESSETYESTLREARKATGLLRKGAAAITQLIAKEFFLPFAIVMLALVSTIYAQAEKGRFFMYGGMGDVQHLLGLCHVGIRAAEVKLVESQELGSVVERKELAEGKEGSTDLHSLSKENVPEVDQSIRSREDTHKAVNNLLAGNVPATPEKLGSDKGGRLREDTMSREKEPLKTIREKRGFVPEGTLIRSLKKVKTLKPRKSSKGKKDAIDDIFSAFD